MPRFFIQSKQALGLPAHQYGIAFFDIMQDWRKLALRDELKKEFDLLFERAGDNGIGLLMEVACGILQTQGCVLARLKGQSLLRQDANGPEVVSVILARHNFSLLKFFRMGVHGSGDCSLQTNSLKQFLQIAERSLAKRIGPRGCRMSHKARKLIPLKTPKRSTGI